jgi:hypothetical protein
MVHDWGVDPNLFLKAGTFPLWSYVTIWFGATWHRAHTIEGARVKGTHRMTPPAIAYRELARASYRPRQTWRCCGG